MGLSIQPDGSSLFVHAGDHDKRRLPARMLQRQDTRARHLTQQRHAERGRPVTLQPLRWDRTACVIAGYRRFPTRGECTPCGLHAARQLPQHSGHILNGRVLALCLRRCLWHGLNGDRARRHRAWRIHHGRHRNRNRFGLGAGARKIPHTKPDRENQHAKCAQGTQGAQSPQNQNYLHRSFCK